MWHTAYRNSLLEMWKFRKNSHLWKSYHMLLTSFHPLEIPCEIRHLFSFVVHSFRFSIVVAVSYLNSSTGNCALLSFVHICGVSFLPIQLCVWWQEKKSNWSCVAVKKKLFSLAQQQLNEGIPGRIHIHEWIRNL